MTAEKLVAIITVLLFIAGATERLIELVKPLIEKWIKDAAWLISVKITAAVLVAFGLAALFQYDLLTEVGLAVAPVLGYLATGLVSSVGSSVLHPLLEWLKTLKLPPRQAI